LRKPARTLVHEPRVSSVLSTIHHDEARHAHTAADFARQLGSTDSLASEAIDTRERLVSLLTLRADEFETLGVCPDLLVRRLRRPPRIWLAR
jgi:hypothetical protein